ncbi:MAG TPA: hypothetical protein VJT71_13030 [Pyrinomonadaceae bacterium]|nr:hypothetical protein [Pyrinomonadaceae bacterium]
MKTRRTITLAIVSLFLLGITINAEAQRRRSWDNYPNWGGSFDLRQTALNAGYNEGTKEGSRDRARNRHANFQEFSAYREATKDYSSRLGDRELYQRYFRIAFERGYDTENPGSYNNNSGNNRDRDWNRDRNRDRDWDRDNDGHRGRNWDRYGQFGGSFELRQTALNAGYNAGAKQGRDDRRRNRNRSYSDFKEYRDANIDYSSKLGDRELYRRYFREGYENGYRDGWNGY